MTVRTVPAAWATCLALLPAGVLGQSPQGPVPGSSGVLTLPEAVAMALDHHPSVGEARAQRDVAAGVLRQSNAARLPALYTDYSLTRFQEPMLVAPLHGFDPTMAPAFDRDLVRGNLSVSYTLFDGGARGARIGQARAGEAGAMAGETASELELTLEVSAAYLGILTTVDLLEAAAMQREALEAEEERVIQFLAEGKAARVDLLRVQASLSQREAAEISLQSQLELARGRLARLTGLPTQEVRSMELVPLHLLPAAGTHPSAAVERARSASPELRAARSRLAGAEAGAREATASWFPSVRVVGAYSDFGALDGGHTLEWQGALQLSFPLFTGGMREGERDRARAEERRASETLRRTELAVEEGVEEAVAAGVETRARREALERAQAQAEEVARIEALALEVGAGVQTDFLRAQAELFQSRAALAQARYGEVLAGLALARVMGDLTLGWIQENTEVGR